MATRIQQRRGTTAEWAAANPILAEGESGIDIDTLEVRYGDGLTPWSSLPSTTSGTYGFRIDVSPTPPLVTTVDGLPLMWVPDQSALTLVPTTPTAPSFNYSTYAVTPPSVTGVEYQFYDPTAAGGTWLPIPSGSATSLSGFTRPFLAKVRAVALPGYTLTASYEWSALFYTEASLVLWATDGFSGTAGTVLAPAASATGRSFDMTGGGSAAGAGIPKWLQTHPTLPSGWMVNGSNVAVRATGAETNNGSVFVDIGADNWRVEIDTPTYPSAHGRNFGIRLPTGGPDLVMDTPSHEIRFGAIGTVGATTYVWRPRTDPATGTWKVALVNKAFRVTAPDGQTWTKDYSAATVAALGNMQRLSLTWGDFSGANPGVPPTLDTVRIYK